MNDSQPFVVPPNSGRVLRLIGVTHKLISQQTGGGYYLFESEFDPESGNTLHVHKFEDEVVLALAIPGGMEMFFEELESALQDGSMDDAKHREISRKYGIEWLD